MKLTILILLTVSSFASAPSKVFAKDFLTKVQKKIILDQFDNASSDNIDEGDCITNYKLIQCDDHSQACIVFFRFDECVDASLITPAGVTYSCILKNVSSFSNLRKTGFEKFSKCYYENPIF